MGATYTRQSSYSDGDTITAAHTNDEFNQLLAAFASSSGHTHDGTTAEGGPITKLLGTSLTLGDGTSGTDITVTYDGESNDGVMKWMEDEDYFEFSDDILVASTEKLQFRDTAIYINSSTDGQLDLVADTEIQIAATTVDLNGNLDVSGSITLGGTAITSTAAELNILDGVTATAAEINLLDGVSGLVQADFTKLAAVDSTATELNIVDGNTSIGTTAVSDGHGIVMNHGGTMAQTTVQTLAAYLDDEITAMPNLVTTAATTVGALNSGSITSGFGAIDNGSSAITTTGTVTYGSLSDGSITITAFVDEDNMASNSATLVPTQQSVKAYVDTQLTAEDLDVTTDSGTIDIDLDSDTLTIAGGTGLSSSASSTTVTMAVDAAQTGITSLLATDIKIGEDNETKIDFETANEIHFYAANAEQAYVADGVFGPQTDSDVDLGTTSVRWKDAYIDSATITDNVTIGGNLTVNGTTTTVATTNMVVADNLIELNNGASSNSNDSGLVIERGSTGDNAIFMWDESADTFVLGTTTATGASTGNLTVTDGALQAGSLDISGNIDIDGTANLDIVDIDGAVDMASTLTVAGVVDITDTTDSSDATGDTGALRTEGGASIAKKLYVGTDLDVDGTANLDNTDIDGTLAVDGTTISLDATTSLNIDNSNTSNGITIGTATSGVPVSIGHSTSEVTVNDNMTVTGTMTQTGISTSTAKDVFNAGMSVKNGSTSAGFIELFEDSDNGTNKVTLIGPASTSDITLTLPSTAGTVATTASAADEATALAIALG